MQDVANAIRNSRKELQAAVMLSDQFPTQAYRMLTASVTNAVRSICAVDGWDFERDTKVEDMLPVMSKYVFCQSGRRALCAFIQSADLQDRMTHKDGCEYEDDARLSINSDIEFVKAFVEDAAEYVTMGKDNEAECPALPQIADGMTL